MIEDRLTGSVVIAVALVPVADGTCPLVELDVGVDWDLATPVGVGVDGLRDDEQPGAISSRAMIGSVARAAAHWVNGLVNRLPGRANLGEEWCSMILISVGMFRLVDRLKLEMRVRSRSAAHTKRFAERHDRGSDGVKASGDTLIALPQSSGHRTLNMARLTRRSGDHARQDAFLLNRRARRAIENGAVEWCFDRLHLFAVQTQNTPDLLP